MKNSVKIGDHFDYDLGNETFSLPVKTVVTHIDGETAILKVISMYAECEDLTLKYDNVVEFFPDFTDTERNMYSRYLFLDIDTLDLFDDPYYYYASKNEESEEVDGEDSKDIHEKVEGHSAASDNISEDLPF